MLSKLKNLFGPEQQDNETTETDIQLAAATLMFELIRADGQVDEAELRQLRKVLVSEFSLSDNDVEALISDARESAEDAISLQGFTRQICDQWGNEKRQQLLEYLWVLALADNRIDSHERHLVRKVAGLLYMTDRQINLAKESAKSKMATSSRLTTDEL